MLRNITIQNQFVQISLVSLSLSMTGCGTIAPAPGVSAPTLQADAPASNSIPQAGSPPAIGLTRAEGIAKSTPNGTQRSQRQTVADYFLAVPSQYLHLSRLGSRYQAERQQLLEQAKQGQRDSVYDLDNGYLRLIPGGDTCSTLTVVIFSRPASSPLVALNFSCTVGDQVSILDPDQNWQDVTTAVLPVDLSTDPDLDDMPLEVKLPRVGRTIEIHRQRNNQTFTKHYRFNGQQFAEE